MNGIPADVERACNRILGGVSLESFYPIAGGCINHGGRLKTSSGSFFLKWNAAKKYPGMFKAEEKGLNLLKKNSQIHIPDVMGSFDEDSFQGIVLEFVGKQKQI